MKFIFVLIAILRLDCFVNGDCKFVNASRPTFSKAMLKDTPLIFEKDTELFCCVYGVTRIIWSHKTNATMNKWSTIRKTKGRFSLSKDNRTLTIINPIRSYHNGKYKCTGFDDKGYNVTGFRNVVVYGYDHNHRNQIIDWTRANPLIFKHMSNHTIFCTATLYTSFNPNFMWYKLQTGNRYSIIKGGAQYVRRKSRINNYQLQHGYDGSSQISISPLKPNYYSYNFTLTLWSLKKSHEGIYLCEITYRRSNISRQFKILLQKNDQIPISWIIGIISCFAYVTVIIYMLRYTIVIVIKDTCRRLLNKDIYIKKYNFFFLYNFEDNEEFKAIFEVVNNLKGCGYSSFFFHRDKTYGRDTLQDIIDNIGKSNIVVIWLTESFMNRQLNDFCVQMLIKNFGHIKRAYVLTTNYRNIESKCNSNTVTTDFGFWCTSKLFKLDAMSGTIANPLSNFLRQWNYYQFLTWLICSLPIDL